MCFIYYQIEKVYIFKTFDLISQFLITYYDYIVFFKVSDYFCFLTRTTLEYYCFNTIKEFVYLWVPVMSDSGGADYHV